MPAKKALFLTVSLYLFVQGAFLLPIQAFGQSRTTERTTLTEFGETNPFEQLQRRLSASNVPIPLEGALDPELYIVGPGDLFNVFVGGPEPALITQPVSADGYLSLTDAGSVRVAGQTLAEAKRQALAVLRPHFEHVQVHVSLAQPRQFYVHVSGAVPIPGRFLATPVARLAGILDLAYADTTRAPVFNQVFRPSLRNIKLIRNDGSEHSVDLQRYFATGDTRHNPYLNDGDIVFVPTFDPNYEAVFIDGAVAFPGVYDYCPGDTVADLLALATGEMTPSKDRTVRFTHRRQDGTKETSLFDVSASATGEAQSREIAPLDHLYVMPEEKILGTASVEGWVWYPGTYSIEPDKTTLRDLLEMAGGQRPGALIHGAYLERRVLPDPIIDIETTSRLDMLPRQPDLLEPDTTLILQNMRLSEFDFMSRAYFAQEMRLQNRVSVNVEAALVEEAPPVMLKDGDKLVIPRDENTVYVFGQVTRPGFVAFNPGKLASFYVDEVGGTGALAGDTFVIKAGTGQYLPPDQSLIQSGDMIFVDREIDLAESADLQRLILEENRLRKDAQIRTTQVIAQVVTTIALVVTTYLNVRK